MQSTILNVGDDETSRYNIGDALRRSGFNVWEAANGKTALDLARNQPDLVLLDVTLPDISGLEVCRRLKNDPETSSIPILHITASQNDYPATIYGEGSADAYLIHPVEPAVLTATINAFLRAKKAEVQWQTTFDSIGDGICLLGLKKEVLRYNKAFENMLQLKEEDLKAPDINDLLQRKSLDFSPKRCSQDFHIDSRCFHMALNDVQDVSGRENGFVLTIADITNRRHAEEALEVLDDRLHAVLDNTTALVYIVDTSNKILLANHRFESLLGKTKKELIGKSLYELFSNDIAKTFAENNAAVLQRLTPIEFEESNSQIDGLHTYISVKVPLFDKQGKPYAICGISTDITARKQAEEKIRSALLEKELLLQEIHHRVKNNLQVIISLLGLQSQHLIESEAIYILEESRRRIKAMALIHENLFAEHGSGGLNLTSYIKVLATEIINSCDRSKKIEFIFHGDAITVELSKAVPIGLIINELLTNSLKYAYNGVTSGILELSLSKQDGLIQLLTRDYGCGLPPQELLEKSKTLGWKLINLLVNQIDGKLEILTDQPGTNIRITF